MTCYEADAVNEFGTRLYRVGASLKGDQEGPTHYVVSVDVYKLGHFPDEWHAKVIDLEPEANVDLFVHLAASTLAGRTFFTHEGAFEEVARIANEFNKYRDRWHERRDAVTGPMSGFEPF